MCRNAAPGIRMISQLVAGVTARRVRGSDRSTSLNTPSIRTSARWRRGVERLLVQIEVDIAGPWLAERPTRSRSDLPAGTPTMLPRCRTRDGQHP